MTNARRIHKGFRCGPDRGATFIDKAKMNRAEEMRSRYRQC